MNYSVPGLARGIAVMKLLEEKGGMTLDQLAQKSRFPKSSVFRIMDTLISLNLAQKDNANKTYIATARIIPIKATQNGFEEKLKRTLQQLAETTACTAEWYLATDAGLIMADRAEPPASEISINAGVGFIREWRGELDSVACVGRAWWPKAPRITKGIWVYKSGAIQQALSSSQLDKAIDCAKSTGCAVDKYCNTNGVRRIACAVLRDDSLLGILALAQCYSPRAGKSGKQHLKVLIEKAKTLNLNAKFRYKGETDR